jgi:prefoldin subunit 5
MNTEIDVNVLVATLQKKITDLTLTNVVLEARLKDLSNRLNSIIEKENAINGKQNQTQEFNDSEFSTPDK